MKKILFSVLWVTMIALVMSSCAKEAYKQAIPANAPVVVELDLKSVAKKADLVGQKDAISKLLKSLGESDADKAASLMENPLDWGIDFLSPAYVFVGATVDNGCLLISVKNQKDLIETMKSIDEQLQVEEDGDYMWLSENGALMGVVTKEALLAGTLQEKDQFRKLLEQDKENSFFASEAGQMLTEHRGDITMMLNPTVLSSEVKAMAIKELIPGRAKDIPGVEGAVEQLLKSQLVLNLLCEDGKISLNLISNQSEEANRILTSKIDPAVLEQIPADELVEVMAMSVDGKALWGAIAEAIKPFAIMMNDEDGKMLDAAGAYVEAMNGTIAMSVGGKDIEHDPKILALLPAPKAEWDKAVNSLGLPIEEVAKVGGDDRYTALSTMPYTYGSVSAGFDKAKNAKNSYVYAFVDAAPIFQMTLDESKMRALPAEISNQVRGLINLADYVELKVEETNQMSLSLLLTDDSQNALALIVSRCLALGQSYVNPNAQ